MPKELTLLDYYDKSEVRKLPNVYSILEKNTSTKIKGQLKKIQETDLPSDIVDWANRYERVGVRKDFIWAWLYEMFQVIQFPTVDSRYNSSLLKAKTLLTMHIVLLDDIADKTQEKRVFEEIYKTSFFAEFIDWNNLTKKEQDYIRFDIEVWNEVKREIMRYPGYKNLEEIFYFDIDQVLNANRYSCLLNKNLHLINKSESWVYPCFNMAAFTYTDLDLMCSVGVNPGKIGLLREVIWNAQKMARIGNWLSTWEREIYEDDYTGGVFALLAHETNGLGDFRNQNKERIICTIKKLKLEEKLLGVWENCYDEIKQTVKPGDELEVPVKDFLLRLENLLVLHLISKGYK